MTLLRSNRKPSQTVIAEIDRLRRYSEQNIGKSDQEIIKELGIKERRYYRYKQKIREQDIAAWYEVAKESEEESLLKIKKALDFTLGVYTDIVNNSQDSKARIAAAQQIIQNNIWYQRLLEKGPKIMPKLEARLTEQTEELESVRNSTV